MFLLRSDFRKDILILLLASILLGTALVLIGGYITDKYFANMVAGLIGEYGEYDLLFTLASDKEDIALEQIKNVAESTLPGSKFKTGPRVAGSSNYLLKLPDKYKNETIYRNIGRYFADIPGLMSKTIMTEPRLSVRGFRGGTRPIIESLIENIDGVDFVYPAGDGLDIIVKKPELVPAVKGKIAEILDRFRLLEIRYPLNQHPDNLAELKEEILNTITKELNVKDVTRDNDSERISLLNSLKEMKTFLLSYATRIIVTGVENSETIPVGIPLEGITADGRSISLEVVDNKGGQLASLIQQGEIDTTVDHTIEVYGYNSDGSRGELIGTGSINNPRQELATALDKLNEITPALNGFLTQSEQLVTFSARLDKDLNNINQGLLQLEESGQKVSSTLQEWQKEGLSNFLKDLLVILAEIENNIGNINDIQGDLIKTSNQLKEGARLIEEKLIFVPRNNSIYQQLFELKTLFLRLATVLDQNYDLVAERMKNMDPVLNSIDGWRDKINSLLKVGNTLNSGANWQSVESIISEINKTAEIIDTRNLQEKLQSVQDILVELKTTQLPVVLDQLTYIQGSLPDLKESEIVETINLIDSYIAGEVIPGDQIQLLIQGGYDSKELTDKISQIIKNPAVTFIEMDAGIMQPNPRGEVFNVLRQVKAVISTIIAIVFTLLVMIMDQTLIISVTRLNNRGKGYIYSFVTGGLTLSLICLLSQIEFPYLNFKIEFILGGILGVIIALLAGMLNPVSREEWEAGMALGFSPAEVMHEIIIPAGKPGILYLINYPKVIFR